MSEKSKQSPLPSVPELASSTSEDKVAGEEGPVKSDSALESPEEALRIQAAAVAAEQARLTELEQKIDRKRVALEKQESQVATHLDERRRDLAEKQQRLQKERQRHRRDLREHENEVTEAWIEIRKAEQKAKLEQDKAKSAQERWDNLRKRLKERWQRQWNENEKEFERRNRELEKQQQSTEKLQQELEAERAELVRERLRFNGERELERHKIHQGWEELAEAKAGWKREKEAQKTSLKEEHEQLRDQVNEFRQAQQLWIEQCSAVQITRDHLENEIQGLEKRAQQLGRIVNEQEQQVIRRHGTVGNEWTAPRAEPERARKRKTDLMVVAAGEDPEGLVLTPAIWEQLQRVPEELEDQRSQLVRQWEQFLRVQQAWHEEHQSLIPSMEGLALLLEAREANVQYTEQMLEKANRELGERQKAAMKVQLELEAWHSRLQLREEEWGSERAQLLSRLEELESVSRKERQEIQELRERWQKNRKREVARLKQDFTLLRKLREESGQAWRDLERRLYEVQVSERSLAERTYAVDQLQVELTSQSDSAVLAEKRFRKHQQKWKVLHEEAEQGLEEAFEALQKEIQRIEALRHAVDIRLGRLIEGQNALSKAQTAWEHDQLAAQQGERRQETEQNQLTMRLHETEARLTRTQEELDRILNLLIDGNDEHPFGLRAA